VILKNRLTRRKRFFGCRSRRDVISSYFRIRSVDVEGKHVETIRNGQSRRALTFGNKTRVDYVRYKYMIVIRIRWPSNRKQTGPVRVCFVSFVSGAAFRTLRDDGNQNRLCLSSPSAIHPISAAARVVAKYYFIPRVYIYIYIIYVIITIIRVSSRS